MDEDVSSGRADRKRRGRRAPVELSPIQRAVGLLSRREHSRAELVLKLCSRGLVASEVEAAVAKLAHDGWQDDARFAEFLVRSRVSGGYGPIRIRAELATHGLDREAIAIALATFNGNWAENARDLVHRRYGSRLADDLALRRKAADFLLRRGFDGDCIRAATRPELDG